MQEGTMNINIEIKPVAIEINGKRYPVAPKSIATAKALARVANDDEKPNFQKWLEQMAVVIGQDAVDELFPSGEEDNLDRMEALYHYVMASFDHHGRALRAEREKEELNQLKGIADTLTTIAEKIREINEKYPGIARP